MAILKGNEYTLSADFQNESDSPNKDMKIIKSSLLQEITETVTIGEARSGSMDQYESSASTDMSPSFFDETPSQSNDFMTPESTEDVSPASVEQTPVDVPPQEDVQPYIDDLVNAINGLKASRDQVLKDSQHGLVNLSLDIAQKIINKAVELDDSIIKGIVEDTFNKISGSDRVTFKVCAADLETFNKMQPYFESRLIGVDKITIQQDPSIDQGGCVIETDLGFVDVTIKEKLNIVAQAFKKVQATL